MKYVLMEISAFGVGKNPQILRIAAARLEPGSLTPVPGFHIQKCGTTTLKGMLRTVAAHDTFRDEEGRKAAGRKLKPKETKKAKKKEKKRKIRRTLSLIEELRSSGRM